MVLRDIQRSRPPDDPLRVVCMSATLNSEQFSRYFDGAPCVHIPVRTVLLPTAAAVCCCCCLLLLPSAAVCCRLLPLLLLLLPAAGAAAWCC